MSKPRTAFTAAEVADRKELILTCRPGALTIDDATAAGDIISFVISGTPNGAFVRFRTASRHTIDLYLHPAVAMALRESLVGAGMQAGWMGEDGSITYPHLPEKPRTGH